MANRKSLGTVKRDLVRHYVYHGEENLERVARIIFNRYKQFLADDKGGCYDLAFRSAVSDGLIISRASIERQANERLAQLGLENIRAEVSGTDETRTFRQTPEEYEAEYADRLMFKD